MDDHDSSPRRKERSPGYPSVNLRIAIERARIIWDKEKRHAVPNESIFRDLGYAGRSGPSLTMLATLKRYGLLIEEGRGRCKLSDLAVDIILAPTEDHPDRVAAIRRAALAPTVFSELWGYYGGDLPSDDSLRYHLVRNSGFTEEAANVVVRVFRETIEFAEIEKLAQRAIGSQTAGTSEGETATALGGSQSAGTTFLPMPALNSGGSSERPRVGADQPNLRVLTFPLSSDSWATLQLPTPISEEEWNQLEATLRVFKPALVRLAPLDPGGEEPS